MFDYQFKTQKCIIQEIAESDPFSSVLMNMIIYAPITNTVD